MKHTLIICTFALVFILAGFPSKVFAHFMRANDGISLSIHLEPDDEPYANQETKIRFIFTDKNEKLVLNNCDCWVWVMQDDTIIDHKLMEVEDDQNGNQIGRIISTFPQKGVYKVKIQGEPIVSKDFSAFHFEYDVRVDRVAETPQKVNSETYVQQLAETEKQVILVGILAIISTVASYFHFNRKGV